MDVVLAGFLASLAAGLATGVGALPAFVVRSASDRSLDSMLGFAAGVMAAASAFSLLVPALEVGSLAVVLAGTAVGAAALAASDAFVPHEHFGLGAEGTPSRIRRVWLITLALAIHNLPEGLSVGVGFGLDDRREALVVAVAIGLQNLPEGLAVALPMIREGFSPTKAVLFATATGLLEPIGGLVGASAVALGEALLPFGLAFAAGAMLYVVFGEMIPESHGRGHHKAATIGAIAGFLVMMALDNAIG